MLPAAMRRRFAALLLLLAALALPLGLSACGDDESADEADAAALEEAVEGEPLELGELGYNVQITRFLNPDDIEDSEYLAGMPEPKPGTDYLGVFIVIKNDSEEGLPSASDYVVTDTLENEYEPLESESPYALDVGAEVAPESQLPIPGSTAATGPNQAALIVFEVSEDVSDNRPLIMEIKSGFGDGEIILDI